MKIYMVSSYRGQAGRVMCHRCIIRAESKDDARRLYMTKSYLAAYVREPDNPVQIQEFDPAGQPEFLGHTEMPVDRDHMAVSIAPPRDTSDQDVLALMLGASREKYDRILALGPVA